MSEGTWGAYEGQHNHVLRKTACSKEGGNKARHRVPAKGSIVRDALQGALSDDGW